LPLEAVTLSIPLEDQTGPLSASPTAGPLSDV